MYKKPPLVKNNSFCSSLWPFCRQRHMAQLFALAASLCALHVCSVVAPQSSNSTIKGKEVVIFFLSCRWTENNKVFGTRYFLDDYELEDLISLGKNRLPSFRYYACPFKGSYFLWEVILCSSCCHSTFPTCIVGKQKQWRYLAALPNDSPAIRRNLLAEPVKPGGGGFLPPETPTENSVFHQPPEVCLPAQGSCREKATSSLTRIFWSTGQLTNFSGGGQLKDLLYFCPECLGRWSKLTTAHIFFK